DAAVRVAAGTRGVPALLEVVVEPPPFDRDAALAQERLRDGACRHDGRRVTRARTLERVAHVGEPVLQRSREVGVSRPRERDRPYTLPRRLAFGRPGAHAPRPARVVSLSDAERER